MFRKMISIVLAAALAAVSVITAGAAGGELVSAPSAVLMEASTGKILYQKNLHDKRPCASVTKVMTLLLVFEAMDSGRLKPNDVITASEHAASMGGSDIWLEPGESMTADDMIKATVVASANDAAVALAEHLCGSEDTFVAQMNDRAAQLGMHDTTFKNCNGLDEDGHVTSACDVALMSRELMKHEKILDYTSIWLDNLRGGKTQIVNTNKLLKTYKGITGLKTGTTDDAGCCIAATATRGDLSLIGVVLGAATGKQRFADAAALLDYGFSNFAVKKLTVPENLPQTLPVTGGMQKEASLSCEITANAVVNKASDDEAHYEISLPEALQAPVEQGEKVGSVRSRIGSDERSFDILSQDEIPQASFGRVFGMVAEAMLRM